jgi:hypothetical protein
MNAKIADRGGANAIINCANLGPISSNAINKKVSPNTSPEIALNTNNTNCIIDIAGYILAINKVIHTNIADKKSLSILICITPTFSIPRVKNIVENDQNIAVANAAISPMSIVLCLLIFPKL